MAFLPLAAAAVAALTTSGMYLDAKYSVRKDVAQIRSARRIQKYMTELYAQHGENDWSFYHIVHSTYHLRATHGSREAFQFEGRSWTYDQFRQEIGRLAECFTRLGVRNRTVVGIFANNSPEFMFAWWALFKLGAVPAPINPGITGEYVRHCLKVCDAEFLLCTLELFDPVLKTFYETEQQPTNSDGVGHPAVPHLKEIIVYDYGTYPQKEIPSDMPSSLTHLRHQDLPPPTPEMGDFPVSKRPRVQPTSAAQYLFTSGTTGLPKAVTWPTGYSLLVGCPGRWPGMTDTYRRFYICLPMFHGTALFAAMPGTLATSGTVIIARRFSRRAFWSDVRKSEANTILYIGEMLRYLVQAPRDPGFPDEKDHRVTLAYGLGLSPTVWRAFRERFGIPWIVEYYSASEATASLLNSNEGEHGIGKVAHWGPLMRSRWFGQTTFYIVKTDFESGEILRDPKTGFCIRTQPGEVGESIARILPPILRRHDYVGDDGKTPTEKKTLRNVFEDGDEFFRLGDAMLIDEDGFISFNDRLGDTYRVKGHNISTTEVEGALSRHPNIESVNVYAIAMNRYGYEGQLGCAAVTLKDESFSSQSNVAAERTVSELEHWLRGSQSSLPSYAVPRFLRVLAHTEGDGEKIDTRGEAAGGEQVSSIMKKLKVGLRKQGFSLPPDSRDRMYWIENEGSGYVILPKAIELDLLSGRAKL